VVSARAGGADERLDPPELAALAAGLTLCLVVLATLAWLLRAFFGGTFDARDERGVGVLFVGIFTSSHPSPVGAHAWPVHAVVEST
jgi:hypothetical protein